MQLRMMIPARIAGCLTEEQEAGSTVPLMIATAHTELCCD